jgi:transposase
MMPTKKFITKLFRLKGLLKVVDVSFKNRGKLLEIYVKPDKNGCRCPECDRRGKIVRIQNKGRKWKDLCVNGIKVIFIYRPKEIVCETHGRVQENIPWSDPFSRNTLRFEYALLYYCKQMTQKSVCEILKISSSTLSDILHRIVTRERSNSKIRGLKFIGADEISYKKGHKYATIVYDLETSAVVWAGKGKGSETLETFLKENLSQYQRDQVQIVCCDMGESYISAFKKNLPNAQLVLDRFHIVKALNEAMDEVRKDEWRRVSKGDKKFYKGLRWMLFRSSANRSRKESTTIQELKKSNNRIYRAWLLKDEFEAFWDYTYRGSAEKYLKSWITRALKSRIEPMRRVANTLKKYSQEILAFIDTRITNAKAEGVNRIIKIVKNRASGFRTLEAFIDLIYLVIGNVDIPSRIPKRFHII